MSLWKKLFGKKDEPADLDPLERSHPLKFESRLSGRL